MPSSCSRRRRTRIAALGAAVLLASAPPVVAVGPQFTASVDRARAAVAEPIRLTLTLASDQSLNHVPAPDIDLSSFDVFGPSVSTRVEMVNGRTSFARELTYTLYGRQPGTYAIGPARLELSGQTLQTRALQVEVTRKPARSEKAAGESESRRGGETLEENLFLRVVADRDTVYVGQQVAVRFDLCYRLNLRDVGFSEIPTFTGFWAKELFVAERLAPQRESIGGVPFNVATLRRVALFPTSAGTRMVEPLAVTCSIPQGRSRGSLFDAFALFDDPLFGRAQNAMVRSEPVPIVVLPLPDSGRPVGFAGAVGRFAVRAEAQPLEVGVGDPVTLRVEVVGSGNIQAVPNPEIAPTGFKVYDPNVEVQEGQVENGGYEGRRKLEYILIPERGDRLQIPAVRVGYFDPQERRYRVASSEPIEVSVRGGGVADAEPGGYDLTRSEIEQLGRDIRHIKPDVADLGAGADLHRSAAYWVAHLLLPMGYAGLVAYHKHRRRLAGDVAYARRRRARGEAARRLRAARERIDGGDGFHGALQEAVVAFVADQLNRPAPGLTRDGCRRLLQGCVPAPLAERVDGLLERCEFGRFAPAKSDRRERQRLLAEGEDLVAQLQDSLS